MSGNEKFQRLAEIIYENNHKFPFEVRDPLGVRGVADIRKKILEERSDGSNWTIDFIGEMFYNPEVQEMFCLNKAQIIDVSEYLGLEEGRVFGMELRKMGPTNSHKDMMIASLILSRLMTRGLPRDGMDTIADAGFFNSALSAKFYSKYFGLRGSYFIQETTPKRLIKMLEDPEFEVNLVSNEGTGHDQKNATYRSLLRRFHSDKDFKRRTYHLGHAEIGNFTTYHVGKAFAKLLKNIGVSPDIFISPIGAGTAIMGLGEPLQNEFGTELSIVEYSEFTPVLDKLGAHPESIDDYPDTVTRRHKERVTELDRGVGRVISRRIELNPFIPEDFWERVSHLYQLDSPISAATLYHLHDRGYGIGITSAVAMATAASVARKENKVVLVPIFEDFRDYRPNHP